MAIEAAQLMVKVSADTSQAEAGLSSFQGKLKGIAGATGKAGGAMTAAFTVPLVAAATASINLAADFQQSMSVLDYAAGATSEQLQAMREQALQLGADTVFSANEAAQGMVELAKAGMDAEEVMGAMPGVLDLAAAGQIGVAEAAELTSATLATFGLEAGQSAEVADILAAAANASSANINDLAFGVQNAGSVFASSGQRVDTLATMMAILANNGLNASDAATSLKTMTMRLTAPTAKAAKVMRELGINVFDAEGNMREYRDIIVDMEAATLGMSDAQRSAAFNTVFGADAIRSALILSQEGVAAYDEMNAAVLEQGAAAAMAEAQNSGLNGAIERLKGTIETFATTAATPSLDWLAGMADNVSAAIQKFGELPQPVINASLAFLGLAAFSGIALLAVAGLATALGALMTPVGAVILIMLGLALAVAAVGYAWETNLGDIQTKADTALTAVQGFATGVTTAFEGVTFPTLEELWADFQAGDADLVAEKIATATHTLMVNLDTELNITATAKGLQDRMIAARDSLFNNLESALFGQITSTSDEVRSRGKGQTGGILSGLMSGIQASLGSLDFAPIVEQITQMVNDITAAVQGIDLTTIDWWGILNRLILNPIRAAMAVFSFTAETFAGLVTGVTSAITALPWGDLGGALGGLRDAVVGQLGIVVNDIISDLAPLLLLASLAIGAQVRAFKEQLMPEEAPITASDIETGVDWEVISTGIINSLNAQTEKVNSALEGGKPGALGERMGARVRLEILALEDLHQQMIEGGLRFNASLKEGVNAALTGITWDGIATALGNLEASIYQTISEFVFSFGKGLMGGDSFNSGRPAAFTNGLNMGAPDREFTWPDYPIFEWPSFPSLESLGFSWPSFPSLESLGFEWPKITAPDWLNSFLGALGMGGGGGAGIQGGRGAPGGGAMEPFPDEADLGRAGKTFRYSLRPDTAGAGMESPDWAAIIKPPDWALIILPIDWATYIVNMTWDTFVTTLAWESFVMPLEWAAFVTNLVWESFVTRLDWNTYVSDMTWDNYVSELSWGEYIPSIDWGRFIPALNRPAADTGGAAPVVAAGFSTPGTSRYVSAAGVSMGGGITINVNVASLNNDMDIETLAVKVANKFRQKMR